MTKKSVSHRPCVCNAFEYDKGSLSFHTPDLCLSQDLDNWVYCLCQLRLKNPLFFKKLQTSPKEAEQYVTRYEAQHKENQSD